MNRDLIDNLSDEEFDLRARAQLALAFDPGDTPPAHLLRTTPQWRRRPMQAAAAALLLTAGVGSAVLTLRPPELVRDAIEHEYYERSLHGDYMEPRVLLRQLGLPEDAAIPGAPQLMRPCKINGHRAYHFTTYFERGGIATVFAFEEPVTLTPASGWWDNVHWRVILSREGHPLLLVAQQKDAVTVAGSSLVEPTT
jgi:hypothetical protein